MARLSRSAIECAAILSKIDGVTVAAPFQRALLTPRGQAIVAQMDAGPQRAAFLTCDYCGEEFPAHYARHVNNAGVGCGTACEDALRRSEDR